MKFATTEPRGARLTSAQADAIRSEARRVGWYSIALAQAFQFELMMSQKDVIGQWLPATEAVGLAFTEGTRLAETEPRDKTDKPDEIWVGGLCWEEIDENFVLRHPTTARERCIEVDLTKATSVFEELGFSIWAYEKSKPISRSYFPKSGPVIVNEGTSRPWNSQEFRKKWRRVADHASVPSSIKNKDSRAGATVVKIAGRHFRFFERPRPGQL